MRYATNGKPINAPPNIAATPDKTAIKSNPKWFNNFFLYKIRNDNTKHEITAQKAPDSTPRWKASSGEPAGEIRPLKYPASEESKIRRSK